MSRPTSQSRPASTPDLPISAAHSGAAPAVGGPRKASAAGAPSADQGRVEADLLRSIAARDAVAFAALYDLVSARLFGLIRTIVNDRSASEDVLQETMLQIWNKAAKFDAAAAHPIVWMMLIARGKAIDHVRRRTSSNAAVMRLATHAPHHAPALRNDTAVDANMHDDSLREQAARAIDALPPDQRDAILLAYLGGLTGVEIARHRGVPVGTIKTRIRLGMIRLRETFNRPLEVPA